MHTWIFFLSLLSFHFWKNTILKTNPSLIQASWCRRKSREFWLHTHSQKQLFLFCLVTVEVCIWHTCTPPLLLSLFVTIRSYTVRAPQITMKHQGYFCFLLVQAPTRSSERWTELHSSDLSLLGAFWLKLWRTLHQCLDSTCSGLSLTVHLGKLSM